MIDLKLFTKEQIRHVFRFIVFALLSVLSLDGFSLQPTAQQIEQFKRLSPDQQQNLLRQMGISVPDQTYSLKNNEVQGVQSVLPRQQSSQNRQGFPPNKAFTDSWLQNNKDQLPRFGYDLFAGVPTTFEPLSDIPVSSDYVLGVGDSLKVNMYGKISQFFELLIDHEGMAYIPELGPISLAGLSFSEAKEKITQTIDQKMIGVKASVSMGQLRSIRVFVLGEAYAPGSYVVSSLSTITNALVLSGGISELGSLRNIQLKRQGDKIKTLDLYDLLLKGDTTNDAQLKSGDVVFIPPVNSVIGIKGEVRRPAYYELKGDESLKDLVKFSGGFLASAYPKEASIERILNSGERTLINLDLSNALNKDVSLQDGDLVNLPKVLEKKEKVVSLSGHVERPETFSWEPGMRISQLVPRVEYLKSKPDLDYALIKRYQMPSRKLDVLSFSLAEALEAPGTSADLLLQDQDEIIFFSRIEPQLMQQPFGMQGFMDGSPTQMMDYASRQMIDPVTGQMINTASNQMMDPSSRQMMDPSSMQMMDPSSRQMMDQASRQMMMEQQSDRQFSRNIQAGVDHYGQMPNESYMYQNAQGGYQSGMSAMPYGNEFYPQMSMQEYYQYQQSRPKSRVEIISEIINELRAQAVISEPSKEVSVSGDVRFPGDYPLVQNMTVGDLIIAAGGLTEKAFQLYAELNRVEYNAEQVLFQNRVSLDLSQKDALSTPLKSRDVLQIKTIPNWAENNRVILKGEVRFPGVYTINKDDTLATVIERAGGLTEYAYAPGAMFTRVALKIQQAKQLAEMQERLEADMAKAGIVSSNQSSTSVSAKPIKMSEAQKLLSQLKSTSATGRLVIDLEKILAKDNEYKISLEDGDELTVPRRKNSVTIIGEVQLSISQVYDPDLDYFDYIERSGGMTNKADEERIYVIKANGSVQLPRKSNWFASSSNQLEPGDTIVVPLDAEQVEGIVLWRDLTQIFYQIALGAAAVGSL